MQAGGPEQLLKKARHRAGIAQAELARRAGIPQSVLSAYERGRRQPSLRAVCSILRAAGFDLELRPRVDADRASETFRQLLDFVDQLPPRDRGDLTYPQLPQRS